MNKRDQKPFPAIFCDDVQNTHILFLCLTVTVLTHTIQKQNFNQGTLDTRANSLPRRYKN